MRGNTKGMSLNVKKEASCYDRAASGVVGCRRKTRGSLLEELFLPELRSLKRNVRTNLRATNSLLCLGSERKTCRESVKRALRGSPTTPRFTERRYPGMRNGSWNSWERSWPFSRLSVVHLY